MGDEVAEVRVTSANAASSVGVGTNGEDVVSERVNRGRLEGAPGSAGAAGGVNMFELEEGEKNDG